MNRFIALAIAALVSSGAAIGQGSSSSGGSAGAAGSGGSATSGGTASTSGGSSSGTAGGGSSATGGSGKGAAAAGSAGGGSSKSAGAGGSSSGGKAATLAKADSKMLTDLAEANIAEIETGKLALQKAQSEQAKTFAQKMIDDHTSALSKLQTLAQSKGVQLPKETDTQHKALAKALGAMNGSTFDTQYLKRVGVDDHQRTLQLLQKAQKDAKDPELKAMAAEMLPTVQQHLQMAQQAAPQSAKK